MNSTDRLLTSIVDKKNDKQCFSHKDELDSTVQIGTVRSTRTRTCIVLHLSMIAWRAKRNKNQSATLRALPRNIATWTPQYYAVGVTTSSDSDPVILRGLRQRGV